MRSLLKWSIRAVVLAAAAALYLRHLNGPLAIPALSEVPGDFQVYFKAVERWRSGHSPYDPSQMMTYKYSPGLLGGFIALFWGTLSAGEAWLRFKALSLLVWALTLIKIWPARRPRDLGLLILGLLWTWKGLLEALDFGQLEVLGIAPLLLGFHYATRRPALALVCAGALPFLKLPWALASLGILLQIRPLRMKDLAPAAGVVAILGLGVPLILWGGGAGSAYTEWLNVLSLQSGQILVDEPANQSLSAVAGRLGWGASTGLILAGLATLWLGLRARRGPVLQASGTQWLALLCLASPLSWRWANLWFAELPLWLEQRWHLRRVRLGTAVLVGFWLLTQNPVVQALGFHHWTDLHRAGFITAQWLVVLFL